MSIALDLSTGLNALGGTDQFLAWVRSVDARSVHVTLKGSIREPRHRQFQRALIGVGCRITMSSRF